MPALTDRKKQLFKNAYKEVSQRWIPGMFAHVTRHHPRDMKTIQTIEAKLEAAWKNERVGELDFKQAVSLWKRAHLKVLHDHRRRDPSEEDLAGVKRLEDEENPATPVGQDPGRLEGEQQSALFEQGRGPE